MKNFKAWILRILNGLTGIFTSYNSTSLDKSSIQLLLSLAQSDSEGKCLRYAFFKASGVSATEAQRKFGFDSMLKHSNKVEEAITEAMRIREAIDDMARIKDKALLAKFGTTESDEDTSSSDDDLDNARLHYSSITAEFDALPLGEIKTKQL